MSPAMRLVLAFVAANAFAAGFFLGSADGAQFFWPLRPPLNAGMVGALYLAAGGAVAYAALGGARGRSPPCSWSPPRSSP